MSILVVPDVHKLMFWFVHVNKHSVEWWHLNDVPNLGVINHNTNEGYPSRVVKGEAEEGTRKGTRERERERKTRSRVNQTLW